MSRGEVIEVLGLTGEEADRALALLVSESLAVGNPERDNAVVIAPSIRHYFEVRSASEYVKVKRKLECRLCRMDEARRRVRELAQKTGGVVGRIVLAALAIVLATLLIWLATQVFGGDHDKHDARSRRGVGVAAPGDSWLPSSQPVPHRQRYSLRSAAAFSGG